MTDVPISASGRNESTFSIPPDIAPQVTSAISAAEEEATQLTGKNSPPKSPKRAISAMSPPPQASESMSPAAQPLVHPPQYPHQSVMPKAKMSAGESEWNEISESATVTPTISSSPPASYAEGKKYRLSKREAKRNVIAPAAHAEKIPPMSLYVSKPTENTVTSAPPTDAIHAESTLVATSSVSLPVFAISFLPMKSRQKSQRAAAIITAAAEYVNAGTVIPAPPKINRRTIPRAAKPVPDEREAVSAMTNGYVSRGPFADERSSPRRTAPEARRTRISTLRRLLFPYSSIGGAAVFPNFLFCK